MRLSTGERILIALAEQPEALTKVWDLPREASLPGLSERLGVVRSALHQPLKDLLDSGMVESRQAHVVGGGVRKRTVLHPTDEGRQEATRLLDSANGDVDAESSRIGGRLVGRAPALVEVHGREGVEAELLRGIDGRSRQVVTGLPGIGKTALVRRVVEGAIDSGWNVRWATLDADGDLASVSGDWFDSDSLTSLEAIRARLETVPARTLLVIDEIQSVHPRHADSVGSLCAMLLRSTRPCILVTRAPAPFDATSTGAIEYRLDGLDDEAGSRILGDLLPSDRAAEVSSALGGHPLALHLWTPEDDVPAAAAAVQDFVRETVLERLESDADSALDEFVLAPVPLAADEIGNEAGVASLDEGALLRWHSRLAEIQHLIRNVRLASWPEAERADVHSVLADQWAERSGTRARRIEAHHVLHSSDDVADRLAGLIPAVAVEHSAAAAALLEDALDAMPSALVLRAFAVDVALERGEPEHADRHLDEMPDDAAKQARLARLARLRGDASAATDHESKAFDGATEAEYVRLEISAIARCIDDRLPGEMAEDAARAVQRRIDRCDLAPLAAEESLAAEVALVLSAVRLALDNGRVDQAESALRTLSQRAAPGDGIVRRLRLRCDIAAASDDEGLAFLTARIDAEPDPRGRTSAVHALLEQVGSAPAAVACFERHMHASIREDIAADRRLLAQRWYWRGVLNETERMAAWHEAIDRFRRAECPAAANSLLARLHKLL